MDKPTTVLNSGNGTNAAVVERIDAASVTIDRRFNDRVGAAGASCNQDAALRCVLTDNEERCVRQQRGANNNSNRNTHTPGTPLPPHRMPLQDYSGCALSPPPIPYAQRQRWNRSFPFPCS